MQANGNLTQPPETTTINDPVEGFTYLIQSTQDGPSYEVEPAC